MTSEERKLWMREWFQKKKHDPEFIARRKEANARWRNTPKRREEAKKRVAEWRKRHPEYALEYIRKNKSKLRRYNREYSKQNPEKARAQTQKRRAIIRGSIAGNCALVIKHLMKSTKCYWCWKPFDLIRRVHIDHVTPISRGGSHSPENLVASCLSCNASKQNKFYWEWDGELSS